MTHSPRVSVITPVYNAGRFLSASAGSILGQSMKDLELIFVDDGSTDQSVSLIKSLQKADSRVRFISHDVNKGCAAAYNTGFSAARGQYIAIMDHDDVALPKRLENAVFFLDSHPDIHGCGAAHALLSNNAARTAFNTGKSRLRARYLDPDTVGAFTLFGGVLFNPTICFRKELLGRVSVWHDPSFSVGADDDFFERLIAAGARFANLPSVATLYRRSKSSHSGSFPEIARESRVRIARQAVLRIVGDASPEELSLHGRLVLRDSSFGPGDEPAMRRWFCRLLHHGRPRWSKGLVHVLSLNWQRYCSVMAAKNFLCAWQSFTSFPELADTGSVVSFLYQAQKRGLQRFCKS